MGNDLETGSHKRTYKTTLTSSSYPALSKPQRRVYTCVFEEESEVDKWAKVDSYVINDQRCCV